jgi:hypothetical protein
MIYVDDATGCAHDKAAVSKISQDMEDILKNGRYI